jgi:hypothetical protein
MSMAISARSRRSRKVVVGMLSSSLRHSARSSTGGLDELLGSGHRSRRVHRHHLAGHQPGQGVAGRGIQSASIRLRNEISAACALDRAVFWFMNWPPATVVRHMAAPL